MKPRGPTPIPPGIGKPALRALTSAGVTSLEQVASSDEADLLAMHGVGPKAITILKASSKAHRLGWSRKSPTRRSRETSMR